MGVNEAPVKGESDVGPSPHKHQGTLPDPAEQQHELDLLESDLHGDWLLLSKRQTSRAFAGGSLPVPAAAPTAVHECDLDLVGVRSPGEGDHESQ